MRFCLQCLSVVFLAPFKRLDIFPGATFLGKVQEQGSWKFACDSITILLAFMQGGRIGQKIICCLINWLSDFFVVGCCCDCRVHQWSSQHIERPLKSSVSLMTDCDYIPWKSAEAGFQISSRMLLCYKSLSNILVSLHLQPTMHPPMKGHSIYNVISWTVLIGGFLSTTFGMKLTELALNSRKPHLVI